MPQKIIQSSNGKIQVPYNEVTNTCMCVSLFALLQYLLLHDEDTIKHHTCYFFGYAVDKEISKKLPCFHFDIKQSGKATFNLARWSEKFLLRVMRNHKFPFIKNSKIYAQDLGFLPSLIGKQNYALLADAPNFLTLNMQPDSVSYKIQQKKLHSLTGLLERLLFGKLAICNLGNNTQCKELFLTEENFSPVVEGKILHINSLEELWANSSETKKHFILDIFGITPEDISLVGSRKIMFLTQPIVDDKVLTEKEYASLMDKILSRYDKSQLIMKLHPRDKFDYKKYFPEVTVFNKKVNIQLLVLSGISIERVATICSSSINAFPETIEADWFGADIDPKILQFMGNTIKPFRQCNLIPSTQI